MAGILGYLVGSGTLALADVAEPLEGGQHFPLFLLTLQTLHKLQGKSALTQTFNESKVIFKYRYQFQGKGLCSKTIVK